MTTSDSTNITPPRVPFLDNAGLISRPWFMWLLNMFARANTSSTDITALTQAQYVALATDAVLSNERILTAGTNIAIADGGANGPVTVSAIGVAPSTAQYVTMATDATLTQERVLTAGTNITITDGGANGPVTIAAASTGAPVAAQYVTMATDATLTQERVLTAGANITITDGGANGPVTIAATTSGGYVLLEQHTASSSATLDFTAFISSTYDEYQFELINVLPATNGANLLARVGTGGGPTWDTGNNYGYANSYAYPSAGGGEGATVQSSMLLNGAVSNTNMGSCGHLRLFNPSGTTQYKSLMGQLTCYHSTVGYLIRSLTGIYAQTTAVTGIRFLFSSGNIASGTIRVYGISK
jgi:lysophospholipid acyltransferase (LPLAT)-like uncharacterized protein